MLNKMALKCIDVKICYIIIDQCIDINRFIKLLQKVNCLFINIFHQEFFKERLQMTFDL